MKIKRVEVYQVDLPYAGGVYRLSGGREYTSFDATFTRVITDTGLEGWGESTPFGGTYIAAHAKGVRAGFEDIVPAVLGRDPRQIARVYDAMDGVLMGHQHAKTPIDVACWDILGKSCNMPVCDLLGGRIEGPVGMISSIPRKILRSALDARSMVTQRTAAFDAPIKDGGAVVPDCVGLGITPDMDLMGSPVAVYD